MDRISTDKMDARFEPVITIHWTSLQRDNRNIDYLSRRLITPMITIWKDFDQSIVSNLCLGFRYQVYKSHNKINSLDLSGCFPIFQ